MSRSLHQKITCQRPVLTPTTAGEQQQSSQDIATVWAEVIAKSADMTTIARQNYIAATYLVRVRYQDRLLSTRNILWQGQTCRVVSLRNPDNRQHILEFQVVVDAP